jgi:hypothetical protein
VSAEIVTCCLCGKDWPENSDGVRWRFGGEDDAYCTDYDACARRQLDQEEARDGVL